MPNDSFVRRRHSEGSSALLVVLWSVMILAFAVAMASQRVALIMGDTSIEVRRYQAELLANSALASSGRILKEERNLLVQRGSADGLDRRPLDLQRFTGQWTSPYQELEGGEYGIELRDEGARINWIKTPNEVWRALFQLARVPSDQANAWLDSLADWQKSGDARSLNGANTDDYQNRKTHRCTSKNAAVTEMGELFWVMGGEEMSSLRVPMDSRGKTAPLWPMTTIYGDGKININTAPAILIAAALNLPLEQAEEIVRSRWGPDGEPGTADDLFLDQIPLGTAAGAGGGNTGTNGVSQVAAPSAATTTATLFRVRGVGVFQGQKVVRETLALKEGEFGLRLLREPVTVEAGSDRMTQTP